MKWDIHVLFHAAQHFVYEVDPVHHCNVFIQKPPVLFCAENIGGHAGVVFQKAFQAGKAFPCNIFRKLYFQCTNDSEYRGLQDGAGP
jgi:hypothetical protein